MHRVAGRTEYAPGRGALPCWAQAPLSSRSPPEGAGGPGAPHLYQLYLASPRAAASAAQLPPCLPWLSAAASHPLLTNPEEAWQGSRLQQLWRQQWLLHQQALLTPAREREGEWKGGRQGLLPSPINSPSHHSFQSHLPLLESSRDLRLSWPLQVCDLVRS